MKFSVTMGNALHHPHNIFQLGDTLTCQQRDMDALFTFEF